MLKTFVGGIFKYYFKVWMLNSEKYLNLVLISLIIFRLCKYFYYICFKIQVFKFINSIEINFDYY